ncbi:MAG: hypothetical protein FWC92_06335 [Defluviitaleaceae bacterium]|nr:hypothetical protein [Defluviitaleaceae bacterium]
MGLFQKKKAAIERAIIESTHEIVCLYCFRNFDHNEVVFRAADIIDEDGYRAEPDRLLEAHRARFNMSPMGAIAPVLNPDDYSEKNKGYLRGILTTLYDRYNNPTSTRLCPYCHNDLLPSAGLSPSTVISIVGGSKVGKSSYFASLVHTLKTVTSHNFDMFCTPINNETGRKFKIKYEEPFMQNGYFPSHTPGEVYQEPYVFTFSFADETKPELNIAFIDIADEGATGSANMDIYAAYMRNSSAMIFLVDPLQFRDVSHKIHILNNINFNPSMIASDTTQVLVSLVENYIYKQANGTCSIATAAVLTKTDLLVALGHSGEYIHPRSNLFARYSHHNIFNLSQFDAINYEVDAFLHMVDPNLRNALKRRFANLGFFGVSALGAHPELISKQLASFAPARVDEPLLWILYKLGYISGRYDEVRT